MVANDAKHVRGVLLVALERAQFPRNLGRRRVGRSGHDCRESARQCPALVRIISQAHGHKQAANVRVAETEGPEFVGQLRNFLRRELRHHDADFQRQCPKTRCMDIVVGPELPFVMECKEVHGRQVAGGIIEEHVLRTGVRPADRSGLGACMPGIDRVMVLDAGIRTGPGGMAHLLPQVARLDRPCHLAVCAAEQVPVGVILHRLQERIRDPDRVVGVLARNARISFRIPVGVICRKFDRFVALSRVVKNALDIGLRNGGPFRGSDRGLEALVPHRIDRIGFRTVPRLDCREYAVELALVDLRAGHYGGNFLLLDDLPVDEVLDVGMIGVNDHHLGRAPGGATRLDGAGCSVADLQKAHQARRLAAAGQMLARSAEHAEICPGTGSVLEEP